MGIRYENELERLSLAYDAAMEADVDGFAEFISRLSDRPVSMVGSGGSYSTASFAAQIHEQCFQSVARAVTPLEVLERSHTRGGTICFSASGRNRDIGTAFKALCLSESGPTGALVLSSDTPMHALGRQYSSACVASATHPTFKDGFLAVASLVASAVILIRAYDAASDSISSIPSSLEELISQSLSGTSLSQIVDEATEVLERETTSLIYSPNLKPTSIDLESRFVEAALGNLHIADLRNFGHGRHHWIAKRSTSTGVIVLAEKKWKTLADRTVELLPEVTPVYRLDFNGSPKAQSLAGLIAGLHISLSAGQVAGIDPGKPGVPEFGRKLYRLGPGANRVKQSDANRRAAIARKAPPEQIRIPEQADQWDDAYTRAWSKIQSVPISGVALDYDGTLCKIEERFDALRPEIGLELERLLRSDICIGIATGRGPSAGERLRDALPTDLWGGVVMGYYNGGVITTIEDTRDPILAASEQDRLAELLMDTPLFAGCKIRSNAAQISIRLSNVMPVPFAERIVRQTAESIGEQVSVVSSGHSIDILRAGQSKLDVIDALMSESGDSSREILRIGDQGAWPGNDAEFLNHPLGLSADKASCHQLNCWNFAPAGVRGLQATLYYLRSLKVINGVAKLSFGKGDKGATLET